MLQMDGDRLVKNLGNEFVYFPAIISPLASTSTEASIMTSRTGTFICDGSYLSDFMR